MEKIIVTIGRQFGSGGSEIGKKLADCLHIAYYDKELLRLAAQESGICPELFEKADEKTSGGLLQALSMGFSMNGAVYQPHDCFTDTTLFQVQSDVIRKIAADHSCVIVGRCADYILKDDPHCTSVFIHSTEEDRVKRIVRKNSVSEKEALEQMKKTDKTRASYYNYYTDKVWGAASSYHFCLNSSVIGTDRCVRLIADFLTRK